jgi:hypothetical protein
MGEDYFKTLFLSGFCIDKNQGFKSGGLSGYNLRLLSLPSYTSFKTLIE